jgi:hypothetical protein
MKAFPGCHRLLKLPLVKEIAEVEKTVTLSLNFVSKEAAWETGVVMRIGRFV